MENNLPGRFGPADSNPSGRETQPAATVRNENEERAHQRFLANFVQGSPHECWRWTGYTTCGYGKFYRCGKQMSAHRYSYEHFVKPIPEGLVIDHLCRNPLCVNPHHLEPVTQKVNLWRGTGMAARNARKTHCKNGHPLSGDNLIKHPNGHGCRECRNAAVRRHTARKREAEA